MKVSILSNICPSHTEKVRVVCEDATKQKLQNKGIAYLHRSGATFIPAVLTVVTHEYFTAQFSRDV